MKEEDIWEDFNKYKSTHKKEQALKKLFESKVSNSLEKVCQTLLVNRSQPIKHLLLEIAEVLEDRFSENPELQNMESYQKYKKKEKISDFKNYWYKKSPLVKREDVFKSLESEIQKRYDKSKPGKFSIGVEFELSNLLFGYVRITLGRGMAEPYELSHLAYGYHTSLRSYHNSTINNYPTNQIHLEKKHYNSRNLTKVNDLFRFSEDLVQIVDEFYLFHENLYEEFLNLKLEDLDDNKFLKAGYKKYYFLKNIRLILGILNVQIEANKDIQAFVKKGIDLDRHNHYSDYLKTLLK